MAEKADKIHVSLVAIPDALIGPLSGLYETLTSFKLLGQFDPLVPKQSPFTVEIVAPTMASTAGASGLPLRAHRTLADTPDTDIVIVPTMMIEGSKWVTGRYPEVVEWLAKMHDKGALLCSSCSGALLIAETGLLDGKDATIHWAYENTFKNNFPNVRLKLEEVLVATGEHDEFVMSGASASWNDLAMYLIARFIGPATAQSLARFMLFQWHTDGQAPYVCFSPPMDHDDGAVLEVQNWLADHFAIANPVDEMVRRSGLAERSFKRRFTKATGYTAFAYVQQLRVERAKRHLEQSDQAIDDISWDVGYEDPAFFRRLFKRTTKMTPGSYRQKFKLPDLPLPAE